MSCVGTSQCARQRTRSQHSGRGRLTIGSIHPAPTQHDRMTTEEYVLYFAYGSNMNAVQMRERCASPELRGCATLRGFRFRINTRGVATIVPDAQGCVHGVLWALTPRDIGKLDRYEGVAQGYYVRTTKSVSADAGEAVAVVYVASESEPGKPRPGYLEGIVASARALHLPGNYIAELAGAA